MFRDAHVIPRTQLALALVSRIRSRGGEGRCTGLTRAVESARPERSHGHTMVGRGKEQALRGKST